MTRLVAITQRVVVDPRTGERRDALDQRWTPFLAACNLVGIPIPNNAAAARVLLATLPVTGLILTGGNDLAAYGGDAPERDEAEAAMVSQASAEGWPVVGVCRGAQHLAHLGGGKLARVADHAGVRHSVAPFGREVNSYHDWAITQAPRNAEITATAPDGTIEGFCLGNWVGLMWHPEREAIIHRDDLALMQSLFGMVTH